MEFEKQYRKGKQLLLSSDSVTSDNKQLFETFFSEHEYKLKRINNRRSLDEASYKTLCKYLMYFKNVNRWFNGKSWSQLTEQEIQKVYDDLEDGKILGSHGRPILSTRDYINKVFKSRPFEIAGKKELCIQIMRYPIKKSKDVRFVREDKILALMEMAKTPHSKLLLWLSWDIGENYTTFLKLKKCHFRRQTYNGKPEYLVQLPQEHLKRSRTQRTEPTLYDTTTKLLDAYLPSLNDDDLVIPITQRTAQKMLDFLVNKSKLVCEPNGEKFTFKDMRSSASCHWLIKGWSTDWIKGRLGHAPSSNVLDRYVSYLAIDKRVSKVHMENQEQLDTAKEVELLRQQLRIMQNKMSKIELLEIGNNY